MKKSSSFDRRQFIKLSALSFCASQLFSPSRFLFSAGKDPRVSEFRAEPLDGFETRRAAFEFSKQKHPWLNGFEGTTERSLDRGGFFLTGTVPRDISGTLYRVGPAWLSDQNDRFNHWFEGEGMVQVMRIKTGNLSHRARAIETRKMQKLIFENKRDDDTLATRRKKPSSKKIEKPGDQSIYFPPNQSPLFLKSRLIALADGAFHKDARPVELDRSNFNALNVGFGEKDITSHAVSSHAILDRDKSVWNVVPDFQKQGIVLQRYTPEGKLYKESFHDLDEVGYFHSFVITQTKIVVVVPPLVFADKNSPDYLSSFVWQGDRPCRVLVFDKDNFSLLSQAEVDPFFVMHYLNAFERDGKIIFDGLRYDDATILLSAYRQLMSGQWGDGENADLIFPKLVRFTLDGQNVSQEVVSKNHYEFPSIDHRTLGLDYNSVVLLKRRKGDKLRGGTPYYRSVVVRDMNTGLESGYRYGSNEIPEEHIYIPDRKKPGGLGGWVVGTTYHITKRKTSLYVFQAKSMGAGPVARGFLKYAVPLSCHGTYVPDF